MKFFKLAPGTIYPILICILHSIEKYNFIRTYRTWMFCLFCIFYFVWPLYICKYPSNFMNHTEKGNFDIGTFSFHSFSCVQAKARAKTKTKTTLTWQWIGEKNLNKSNHIIVIRLLSDSLQTIEPHTSNYSTHPYSVPIKITEVKILQCRYTINANIQCCMYLIFSVLLVCTRFVPLFSTSSSSSSVSLVQRIGIWLASFVIYLILYYNNEIYFVKPLRNFCLIALKWFITTKKYNKKILICPHAQRKTIHDIVFHCYFIWI